MTTEVNRTNTAIGLLLLNSPRSTHMDTEDEELIENELLMPIGVEKQPDLVMEIEQQNKNKTSTNTRDSDGTIVLEMQAVDTIPVKPKVGTKIMNPSQNQRRELQLGL